MKLTLKNLLEVKPFSDGKILNKGKINLNKIFDNVTIMDHENIESWIKRDELLIVGNFLETTIDSTLLKKLNLIGCPAIITKNKYVKKIKPEVLETIETINFPIIVVPDGYSWSELTLPIYSLLLKSSQKKNSIYENFNKVLRENILINPEFTNICNILSKSLNVGVALVNKNSTIIDCSQDCDWENLIYSNNVNFKTLNQKKIYEIDNKKLYICDLENNYISYLLLLLPNNYNDNDISNFQTLVQILKLKIKIYNDFFEEKTKESRIVLDKLLNYDKLDISTILSLEMTLKHIIQKQYYVAVFEIDVASYYEKSPFTEGMSVSDFLSLKFSENNDILIFENKNSIIAFISNKEPEEYIEQIIMYLKNYYNTSEVYCGISSYNDIKFAQNSYNQAKAALNFTKANKKSSYSFYTSIGFLRLLTDANGNYDNIYFNELIEGYIIPIVLYDKRCSAELLSTLQIFIETCYSYKKTSEQLFIHVNTLRTRLSKIEELLNIDRHNADDMLNLQIALKVYNESRESYHRNNYHL